MKKLTQQYLKECVTYDPDTGIFTWNVRPVHHFKDTEKRTQKESMEICNKAITNKIAGTTTKRGYEQITINRKSYRSNKLAYLYMTGKYPLYPKEEVDHINHIKTDNSWKNLRIVNRIRNMQNRPLSIKNKSGVVGVRFNDYRWRADITIKKKHKVIGRYKNFIDAVKARYNEEVCNEDWEFSKMNSSAYKYLKENNLI